MRPYLTTAEYKAAPTGVDVSNLVAGGDQPAQDAALADSIRRASGWMDGICGQSLISTTYVDLQRARWQNDGTLSIHPRRVPPNQLVAMSIGTNAGDLSSSGIDLSTAFIDEEQWVISGVSPSLGWPFSLGGRRSGQVLCKLTAIAGWPNTTIVSGGTIGSTSVTVADGVGFTPAVGSVVADQQVVILDGASTETITVSSVAGNVLTCSALTAVHATGVAISMLPPDVKEAAIQATTAFIKARSNESLVMSQTSVVPGQTVQADVPRATALSTALVILRDNYARRNR